MSLFERDGTEPVELAEPYASLLAFLSDVHEQVASLDANDEFSRAILDGLKAEIEKLGLIVLTQSKV